MPNMDAVSGWISIGSLVNKEKKSSVSGWEPLIKPEAAMQVAEPEIPLTLREELVKMAIKLAGEQFGLTPEDVKLIPALPAWIDDDELSRIAQEPEPSTFFYLPPEKHMRQRPTTPFLQEIYDHVKSKSNDPLVQRGSWNRLTLDASGQPNPKSVRQLSSDALAGVTY